MGDGRKMVRVPRPLTAFGRKLKALPRSPNDIPPPPGPFRPGFWRSPIRGPWLTAFFGAILLVGITIMFVTGLLSYDAYNPGLPETTRPPAMALLKFFLFNWPTHPYWLYRVTQGVHVTLGLVLIPILLAKLWSVIPKLFEWPPVRSPAHAIERLSLLLLVGGAIFEFVTGMMNIQYWYRFPGSFYVLHLYGAWVFIGGIRRARRDEVPEDGALTAVPPATRGPAYRCCTHRARTRGPRPPRHHDPGRSDDLASRGARPGRRLLVDCLHRQCGSEHRWVDPATRGAGSAGSRRLVRPQRVPDQQTRSRSRNHRRETGSSWRLMLSGAAGVPPSCSPATTCSRCPSTPPTSRSPASKDGPAETRSGPACGCAISPPSPRFRPRRFCACSRCRKVALSAASFSAATK